MLISLLLTVVTQLPMNGILDEQPRRGLTPPPAVVFQERVVVKKIYVMTDKFGVEHENENKSILIREVGEANAKLFKLQDKNGQWWEHENKATLEQFIYNRNIEIEYQRNPSFRTSALLPINCTPVG